MPRKIVIPALVQANLEFAPLSRPTKSQNLSEVIEAHRSQLPSKSEVEGNAQEKAHQLDAAVQKRHEQHDSETEKQLRDLIDMYRHKIEDFERTAELKLRDLDDYIERKKQELEQYS